MFVLTMLVLGAGGALVSSLPREKQFYSLDLAESHFEVFIQKYDRQYPSEREKQLRFELFKQNLAKINELNQNSADVVFGITMFTDLTSKERSMYRGLKSDPIAANCTLFSDADVTARDAPDSFDWRDKNVVTDVKNQGTCGSCWAFSTIGNVEGQHAMKHGELLVLSEQQLVDCDKTSSGCQGGYMVNGLSKLAQDGGSMLSAEYPYTGTEATCAFDPAKVRAKVTGCGAYQLTDQDLLKQLLFKTGPLAIAMYADSILDYNGGIVDAASCPEGQIDHGVLLVGYGSENGKPYWIVKNSWGSQWGESGYIRILRGKGTNACNIMSLYMSTANVE